MGGACPVHAPESLRVGRAGSSRHSCRRRAISFGCEAGGRAVLSLLGTESVRRGFQRSSEGGGPLLSLSSQPRDQ